MSRVAKETGLSNVMQEAVMTMFRSMCDAETIAHHPGLGHLRDSYGWGARVRGSETDEARLPGG